MRWMLGILTIVLVAGGCTSRQPPADEPDADERAPAATAVARPEWRLPLDLIGQPEVADGVAVVLAVVRGDELDVVAVDVRTGKVRWRAPWSPGNVSPGYGLAPLLTEDDSGRAHVMFQRPARNLRGRPSYSEPIVALRLRSGREVYRTGSRTVSTPLDVCADGTDACVFQPAEGGIMARYDLDGVNLRFRGRDIAMGDNEGRPAGAQDIGDGRLYSTYDGRRVGRVQSGRRVWEKPATAIFGPGRTTEAGWSIWAHGQPDRYTGYLGRFWSDEKYAAYQGGRAVTFSLARDQLVSFRAADGGVVWSRSGVHHCLSDHDVRCRIDGAVVYEEGRDERYRVRSASLEGYDRNGRTTWEVELSTAWAERYLVREPLVNSEDGTAVVETPDGERVVDLSDGSTSAADADRRFVCQGDPTTFQYAVAWGDSFTRTGGRLSYVCDATGRREPGRLTVAAVDHGGVSAGGGIRLVASERGLTAYDVDE